MDGLFRQFGIYSREGQKYQPEDADKVMWYRESKDGVMLEEGINEAGAFGMDCVSNILSPIILFLWFHSISTIQCLVFRECMI